MDILINMLTGKCFFPLAEIRLRIVDDSKPCQ